MLVQIKEGDAKLEKKNSSPGVKHFSCVANFHMLAVKVRDEKRKKKILNKMLCARCAQKIHFILFFLLILHFLQQMKSMSQTFLTLWQL